MKRYLSRSGSPASAWLWLTGTLLANACAPESSIEPTHSHESPKPSTPESKPPKSGRHARVGVSCVLAGFDEQGALKSAVLSRSQMQDLLGITAAELAADTTHAALRFEVTNISGSTSILGCLVPYGPAANLARERIASGAIRERGRLAVLPATAQQRGAADAPSEAWKALRAHYLGSEPIHRRTAHSTGSTPLLSPASEGYDTAGTPPPTYLPTIEVVATQGQWWIFPQHLYDGVRRKFSFSDLINWEWFFYDGPDCADASALWFAQDEEANILEQNAALVQPQIEALATALCDTTVSPLPWCIDFFIQASRAFILGGDDRDFDPDAGWRRSRVQFYFDPNSGTIRWDVRLTESRLAWGSQVQLGYEQFNEATGPRPSELFDPTQDVQITIAGDSVKVKLAFRNGFCPSRIGCPAIDAFLWFVKDASAPGGWKSYWKRDGFPSMEINYKNASGAWTTNARDTESTWTALIFNLRQHNTIPFPCEYQ